jgi:uncharacterized membrane protein HdeD (DUF308 family)
METDGARRQAARTAWGQRHGWSLFLLLGLLLLAVCAWALASDRPAVAGMNVGLGVGFVAVGVWLFVRRTR